MFREHFRSQAVHPVVPSTTKHEKTWRAVCACVVLPPTRTRPIPRFCSCCEGFYRLLQSPRQLRRRRTRRSDNDYCSTGAYASTDYGSSGDHDSSDHSSSGHHDSSDHGSSGDYDSSDYGRAGDHDSSDYGSSGDHNSADHGTGGGANSEYVSSGAYGRSGGYASMSTGGGIFHKAHLLPILLSLPFPPKREPSKMLGP